MDIQKKYLDESKKMSFDTRELEFFPLTRKRLTIIEKSKMSFDQMLSSCQYDFIKRCMLIWSKFCYNSMQIRINMTKMTDADLTLLDCAKHLSEDVSDVGFEMAIIGYLATNWLGHFVETINKELNSKKIMAYSVDELLDSSESSRSIPRQFHDLFTVRYGYPQSFIFHCEAMLKFDEERLN